jgi:hypothetical protein
MSVHITETHEYGTEPHEYGGDEARGGVTGHGVRYVLAISLFAAWAVLSLLVLSSMMDHAAG